MQIYLSQTPETICLTAKAYVTSTYDESVFQSDVTRAFLDVAAREGIPLASMEHSSVERGVTQHTRCGAGG